MALGSLGSLVRRSMCGRSCFSSQGLAAQRNALFALFFSDGRRSRSPVVAAAGTSAFAGSRFLHSRAAAQGSLGSPVARGARWFDEMRDVVVQHADGATVTLSVVVFSVIAGILHSIDDTNVLDEARKEDTPTKTPYLCSNQLKEEMKREMAYYNKAIPDEKTVVLEYMEEDQAMRASFEEWMKAYGRTYKDEVEKARRFKIFKSVVRFTDALNDDASKARSSARFSLNEYSDWNTEEVARLYGVPGWRGGRYFEMVLSCLAPHET